jgi:16S rRNA processing protein RimM
MSSESRIALGRVIGVHGLAGEVAVRASGDSPEGIARYEVVTWAPALRGEERRLVIEASRIHKGVALVKFRGVNRREDAEDLVGGTVNVPREELKPAEEGRHYVVDLIGLPVQTTTGELVGNVKDVLETGANDVFVLDVNGREVLIPVVDHVVKEIDMAGRKIVIEVMEGLLD